MSGFRVLFNVMSFIQHETMFGYVSSHKEMKHLLTCMNWKLKVMENVRKWKTGSHTRDRK